MSIVPLKIITLIRYMACLFLLVAFTVMACNNADKPKPVDRPLKNDLTALINQCEQQHRQGKYDSLIITGKKGLHLAEKGHHDKEISLFSYYLAIGIEARQQRDSAIYYFRKAETVAGRLHYIVHTVNIQVQLAQLYYDYGLPDSVNVYKNKMTAEADTMRNKALKMVLVAQLADIYAKTNQPEKALETHFEVLKYAKTKNDSLTTGTELLDIARVYAQLSEFDKAVSYALMSTPFLKNSPHNLMVSYNDLGAYYVDLKKYNNAVFAFEKAMDVAHTYKDVAYLEATYVSIASPFIELKEYENATAYLNKALVYYHGNNYEVGLLYVLMMLGKMESKKENYPQAIMYFKQAATAAKKTGHLDSESYIYSLLAEVSGKAGLFKEAYGYEISFRKLRDMIVQNATKRNIADLEIKYQSNEKQEKIELLNEEARLREIEIKSGQRKWWFSVGAVCLLLIIVFLAYRGYAQKRDSNRLLEEKNKTLNALNLQLAEANSSKTKLFSILSHDLRAPVSSLFQFLTIKKKYTDQLTAGQQLIYSERIIQSAENLLETMEDLLVWSKSQMDAFTLNLEPVNACELLSQIIATQSNFADEKQLTLEQFCPQDFILTTDTNFIKIVLRNVVNNALKFTPPGGTVKISAIEDGRRVRFEIADNGVGLTDEQVANLFEWNSIRSDTSGLGLKLAKEFTTRLGGNIVVESKLGKGTAFIISVPFHFGDV